MVGSRERVPLPLPCLQLLGRADKIDDFIKRGENEAMTKITLSSGDPRKPTVITRLMSRKENKATVWQINGEP